MSVIRLKSGADNISLISGSVASIPPVKVGFFHTQNVKSWYLGKSALGAENS